MGFFNLDRAEEARDRKPTAKLNDLLDSGNFTQKGELKINDQSAWYQLRRIANALEKIAKNG